MWKILIQDDHSAELENVIKCVSKFYEPVIVSDEKLSDCLLQHKKYISGAVIFRMSDNARLLCDLFRNERFATRNLPVAFVSSGAPSTAIPFGCRLFQRWQDEDAMDFLQSNNSYRILVVEDDEMMRVGVTDMIEGCCPRVVSVADGESALDEMESQSFDLVLLDLMLPGITGREVCERINERWPDTAVVAVTSYDSAESEFSVKANGAQEYIKKPFKSNRVLRGQIYDALYKKHIEIEQRRSSHIIEQRKTALRERRLGLVNQV